MINIVSVYKDYQTSRRRVRALTPVSLQLAAGQLMWVSGPSGAGKSTLLGIVGLLVVPSGGEVWINQTRLDSAPERQRESARGQLIGYVPQSPRLFPELSAARNVMMALGEPDRVSALNALEAVKLGSRGDSAVKELSGGQQQRVSVARAMVTSPKVILADEPSSGLDDANAEIIFTLLRGFADGGGAVLVTSHDSRITTFADQTLQITGELGNESI